MAVARVVDSIIRVTYTLGVKLSVNKSTHGDCTFWCDLFLFKV